MQGANGGMAVASWLEPATTAAAPDQGPDAFGMAPWQDTDPERRRTPSFSAAVSNQLSSAPVKQPQRRETFHAGQFPTNFGQASVSRTNAVQQESVLNDRRQSTPDAFGHLPFNVADGLGGLPLQIANSTRTQPSQQASAGSIPARKAGTAAAGPGLQQPDEVLLFQQAQVKKQEEQLQIHISTLRRKALENQKDQRMLATQQMEQEAQFQQQLGNNMQSTNSADLFGMSDFSAGINSHHAPPMRPARGSVQPSAIAKDDFGMDSFAPSSLPANHGAASSRPLSQPYQAVNEIDGPRQPSASVRPVQAATRPTSQGSQASSQRLARAASELPRLSTDQAAMESRSTSAPVLPRSPDNLFRKLPADGQTWHLMYKAVADGMRQPGQVAGKPRWTPALVILQDSNIFIHEHNPLNDNRAGSQPQTFFETQSLAEIILRHEMAFTAIERKRVDGDSRVRLHTVKLQVHNNQERRSLKNLLAVTHEPIRTTVLKLGSYDLLLLESFQTDVLDAIRKIPIQLYQRTSFSKNEIFVDLIDRCIVMMDCYGVMKAKSSSVQVMVQGFLTGMPECNMIINDTKMIDHRRRTTRGALTMPPHQATIRMCGVQLHPSVNQDAFKNDLQIRFQCMEGVRYEALRFKVAGSVPPPIRVTNLNIEIIADVVNTYVRLELQPHAGRVRHAIEKLEWHFPVPGSWHNILVKKTALGYRSVKSADSLGLRVERSTSQAMLEATVGVAKYEPENSAIVWRLDKFPPQVTSRVALSCHFQIQPGMTKTDFVNQHAMLRYSVVGSCVSGAQVWSLKLDPNPPKSVKKWVRYETDFRYQVDLRPPQQLLASPDD